MELVRCNHRQGENHTKLCNIPVAEIIDHHVVVEVKHHGQKHRVAIPLDCSAHH